MKSDSTIQLKPDYEEFRGVVEAHGIRNLFHFTDKRNVRSIKKHKAIYSRHYCRENNISIPFSASDSLSQSIDEHKGLSDYVRCTFDMYQPMLLAAIERGLDPYVIEISPDVIYLSETNFSDVNAAANNATVGPTIRDFQRINFDIALGKRGNTRMGPAYQAEVLVKSQIPWEFVRRIGPADFVARISISIPDSK